MTRSLTPIVALAVAAALWSPAGVRAAVPTGQPVDGIRCDRMEGAQLHIHQHLTILDHGKPVAIPDDIGRPLLAQCFYWIHTHTSDGIIHIESPAFRSFTLGEFFDIWGQALEKTVVAGAKLKHAERIAVWVSGTPYLGDPRKIDMVQHADVTIEVGPPYAKPKPFTDWNGN